MNHSLTDNLKSRDASASKKWSLLVGGSLIGRAVRALGGAEEKNKRRNASLFLGEI